MTNLSDTIKQDLAEFNKLDQNRKMAVIAIIFGLFVISIIVGANLTRNASQQSTTNSQQSTSGALENAKPSTTVALSPAKETLKAGQPTKIDVVLSKLPVSAADVVLIYDPKQLTVSALTNGVVFPKVLNMQNEAGKITYNASLSEGNPTDRKEGVVFSFMVTPKAQSGSATIDFDHTKTITAINGENTLGSTVGGIYTIK